MPLVRPAGNVDGNVNIEVRADSKKFNTDMKRVEQRAKDALLGILRGVSRLATALKRIVGIVSLLGLGLVTLVLFLQRFSSELFETLFKGIDKTSEYYKLLQKLKEQFDLVKGAVFSLFATLLQAVLPIIIRIVDWLTRMLEKVNMVVAALTGQTTVMRAIIKQTQEQEKAQKGVLAAFDQINVLQTKDEPVGEVGEGISFEQVAITDDILQKVKDIKNEIAEWIQDPIGKLRELWGKVVDWFRTNIFEPLARLWKDSWLNTNVVQPLLEKFGELWDKLKDGIRGLVTEARLLFEPILVAIGAIFGALVQTFGPYIVALFENSMETIGKVFSNTWDTITSALQAAIQVWTGVLQFIRGVFSRDWDLAWAGITNVFEGAVSYWKTLFKGAMNNIIIVINGWLRALSLAINTMIGLLNSVQFELPEWIPGIGGNSFSLNIPTISSPPQIPMLAEGAVIPPNARFLAMLGDQTSGRNLEAPEDLIRQIVREESGANMTVDMPVYLDGEIIYRNQKRIQARHGTSLIASGVVS